MVKGIITALALGIFLLTLAGCPKKDDAGAAGGAPAAGGAAGDSSGDSSGGE